MTITGEESERGEQTEDELDGLSNAGSLTELLEQTGRDLGGNGPPRFYLQTPGNLLNI